MVDLFAVENASASAGNLDTAMAHLIEVMGNHNLFFYKTASVTSGLIAKNDVVILKVNSQWRERGSTNTDLVKAIIAKIVAHPEGFTGEIVIADNGQWADRTSETQWFNPTNAYNHSQTIPSVAFSFANQGYKVSTWLWDKIRKVAVTEFSAGNNTNGYVIGSLDAHTNMVASYPKFTTIYGTRISLKNGIWNGSSYDSSRLKLINIPVLKSHGYCGITGCVKHYMGVLSNWDGFSAGHYYIRTGAMATAMVTSRFPVLNIMDCIYVNANPCEVADPNTYLPTGPDTTYVDASYTNKIVASVDPIALDYYAAKNILIPAAKAKGYTAYASLDPDNTTIANPAVMEFTLNSYLAKSMAELANHGRSTTMNPANMNVYKWQVGIQYTLSIAITGSGTTSPAAGSHLYDAAAVVPVTVYPSSGYRLKNWLLNATDVGNANPYSVTMNQNNTLTAVLEVIPPTQYQLTVGVTGSGSTNATGSQMLNAGSQVSVLATPSVGWMLSHWLRNNVTVGHSNPYEFNISANTNLIAVFILIPPPIEIDFIFSKPYVAGSSVNMLLANFDFVALSDIHVGRSYSTEPDGLSAVDRFQEVLRIVDSFAVEFVEIGGDLIDGWNDQNWAAQTYSQYLAIRNMTSQSVLEVKGNHDVNNSSYQNLIGPLNWVKRFNDILAVGIGCIANSNDEWETSLKNFDQATLDFLDQVLASSDYGQTSYHFLFHHFIPYGEATPAYNCATKGVDDRYIYFDMVFCGHMKHLGWNVPYIWLNHACPAVVSDHIADGGMSMGFNLVYIDRINDVITVIQRGLDGSQLPLLVYKRLARTVLAAPELIAKAPVHFEADRTAALAEAVQVLI